jgi:hypothetical protein
MEDMAGSYRMTSLQALDPAIDCSQTLYDLVMEGFSDRRRRP